MYHKSQARQSWCFGLWDFPFVKNEMKPKWKKAFEKKNGGKDDE